MTNPAQAKSGLKLISEQGEYELGDRIGKGGMGEVHEVYRNGKLIGVKVAKILHAALALSEEAREGLLKEAQIAFQIVHPNLVAVTDIGMIGDAPFIIMERVDGVNLRDFVAAIEKPIPLEVVIYIIGEVAAALAALHDFKIGRKDAGVVHSDVTTGNILISSSGHVKLTDFGIARFAHNDATRSRPIGTPSYMSPEQRLGKTPRATDLFSLGMIFWELLEGGTTRYLADLNQLQRTQAMLNGHIPPFTRPGIPEDAVTLCRQMLSPDPEKRPLAGELSEIIIDKWLGYMQGRKRIEELYQTHIGPKRTGMTKLLDTADFFRHATPESTPIKLTLESAFSAQSAPANERTVVDGAVPQARVLADDAEPDAPSVFRRSPTPSQTSRELTPGSATRVTTATGTETPLSHLRARSRGDEPEMPPMLDEAPAPVPAAANAGAAEQPVPPLEKTQTDEPDIEPTVVLDPPAFVKPTGEVSPADPVAPQPSTPAVSEASTPVASQHLASAPVTELRRRNAALWAVAGVGGVLIILVLVMGTLLLNADRRGTPAPVVEAQNEDATADDEAQETELVPEAKDGPPPVELPVETVPTVDPPSIETDPKDDATDGLDEEDDATDDTATNATKELEGDKARKPKPAPRRTLVGFMFPGEAEIEIGNIKIKGNRAATKELRLKTYPIRWRTLPDGEWHDVGKLTVGELPPDRAYQVTLSSSSMSVRDDARRGSK